MKYLGQGRKFLFTVMAALMFAAVLFAQTGPLNLGQILSELQAQSAVLTKAQKNEAIARSVRERGVTFRLNSEIERELLDAGASNQLITAIRSNGPGADSSGPAKPNATLGSIRIVPNVMEKGVRGIHIVATFNVYNLKDQSSDIIYRFQKDGAYLKGVSSGYRTQGGHLSARRYLKPTADSTVYTDLKAFLPYSEFGLSPGTYDLKLDADVILRGGKLVKHLTLQDQRLSIPAKTARTATAAFEKMWIDYDVKQGGKLGMVVHVKAVVRGMKGKEAYLQLLFAKSDGTRLSTSSSRYRSPSGQTAGYSSLKPVYDSSRFNDVKIFVPYAEFNLPDGTHKLKIHADVVYTDYTDLAHLTYYEFQYSKRS